MPAPARFFVALLPPQPVQDEITTIKQDIWQRFGSRAAFSAPPHITLQPPFHWPLEKVDDLKLSLATFAQQQPPIPVELDGYSAFAPRVLYIDVVQTPALMALQPALMAHLATHCDICDAVAKIRAFAPHVTVGFRDLTPEAFYRAWAEFEQRPFAAEFVTTTLTLLHHTKSRCDRLDEAGDHRSGQKWQVFAEFLLTPPTP